MLRQIEGSRAMAEAIAMCRPEVVCAYPITPQTHIVEGIGEMVRAGELKNCEFINVESEFGALSVAIGASAAGARAYTATASQGLLFMAEAVYNASGLGLLIVMTLGNRAIGAPINIWNDHSDAMSMCDAGWMQLFAETNQEAVDIHIQAFRLASFDKLNAWYYADAPKTIQPVLELARRTSTFEEVQRGLDETNALYEARRCLSCGNCFECDNCYGVCPDNAVIKLGAGQRFRFNYDYCKGCGVCAQECPCGAIAMVPEEL